MRRWILGLGAIVALLAGCGGGTDSEPAGDASLENWRGIVVTLDGPHNAENVGLLMAEKLDYFEDSNLGVELRDRPVSPDRPIQYVAEESVDLAVSHQPQVVLARAKGSEIVAAGSLLPEPTAAMIWLKKSKIGDVADLRGKRIGIYGLSFERALLESILARAGLTLADVKVEQVEEDAVPALVAGRIDAIFGASGNVEGIELESRGLDPVVTPVQSLGVPAYDELVVIARSDRVRSDPQLIPDFMSAVARGTAAAVENPKAAVKAILEEAETSNRKAVEASVAATLPLLSEDGSMDPGQAEQLMDWMREEGLIQKEPPVSEWLKAEAP